MATTKATPADSPAVGNLITNTTGPASWADAQNLVGVDLVDKAEVEGVPFLITGIKNTVSKGDGGYLLAWIEGERADGSQFMFNDAGKGIRQQVDLILADQGKAGVLDEWVDVRVVCPKGVRFSHFTFTNDRGKEQPGRTAYLSTAAGPRARDQV